MEESSSKPLPEPSGIDPKTNTHGMDMAMAQELQQEHQLTSGIDPKNQHPGHVQSNGTSSREAKYLQESSKPHDGT
jgi:hypothetical protein